MSQNLQCLSFDDPVVLLGGAEVTSKQLFDVLAHGFALVAADGGANQLLGSDVIPDAIIGDLDSLEHITNWQQRTDVIAIEEQDSTDFEKCLHSVQAPWYIALGFCGQRLDHTLASLHALMRYQLTHHVLLLSEDDVIVVCSQDVSLELAVGSRLSIFPLSPVEFKSSSGLLYPLDKLKMHIGSAIGTSNSVNASSVQIELAEQSTGCFALIASVEQLPAFEALIRQRADLHCGD